MQICTTWLFSTGYYRDCREALELGQICSGVYSVKPDDLPPFDVYCDMESDGGGWAVFQRRMDGTQDFYLYWDDYVRGFGDLKGEFWLGLSKLHRLTASDPMANTAELRVDLADFANNKAYAKYSTFKVHASDSKYRLTVSGYMGNARDGLAHHNGRPFSTRDRDNDANSGQCAVSYKGAWWYGSCHDSNLNGLYLSGSQSSFADGVNWELWKGNRYSLKMSEMKVRRL